MPPPQSRQVVRLGLRATRQPITVRPQLVIGVLPASLLRMPQPRSPVRARRTAARTTPMAQLVTTASQQPVLQTARPAIRVTARSGRRVKTPTATPFTIPLQMWVPMPPPPSRQAARHGLPRRVRTAQLAIGVHPASLHRMPQLQSPVHAKHIQQRIIPMARLVTTIFQQPVPQTAPRPSLSVRHGRKVRIQTATPFITPFRLRLAHLA